MKIAKRWIGPIPRTCNGCQDTIVKSFSDIKTRTGRWGIFCDDCVPRWSIGREQHYGTGLGQRYEVDPDTGWFVKTAG